MAVKRWVQIFLLCELVFGNIFSLAEEKGVTLPSSPHAKFQWIGLEDARWTEGFWADRFELCHKTVLPSMEEALLHPENGASLINFRIAAGLEAGKHLGRNWSDGDCYKWLEAMARVYAVTGDPTLDREMDYWIDLIARSQEPDGYICTQIQLDPTKNR